MNDEQEAFDEAFNEIAREYTLDVVIERLAAVGVIVRPDQRDVVAQWLCEVDERLPLPVRVFKLMYLLRSS